MPVPAPRRDFQRSSVPEPWHRTHPFSAGSKAVDHSKLAGREVIVLDSGGGAGHIVTSGPGQYKLTAVIHGRRAHAGMAPEEGISAIQVLAEAVFNMKLLRIDEETTANIGSIHADFPTNIVADRAELTAECRSRSEEKLEQQARHMVDCLNAACIKYGATPEVQMTKLYSAYSYDADHPFVKKVSAVCEKAGFAPVLEASGGGSDANVFSANGCVALNLGTGMDKVHTTAEQLAVKDLEDIAALVLELARA